MVIEVNLPPRSHGTRDANVSSVSLMSAAVDCAVDCAVAGFLSDPELATSGSKQSKHTLDVASLH